MGHATSVIRERSQFTIACAELKDGCAKLCKDNNLRVAFVKFVKSGEWIDELAVLVPHHLLAVNTFMPYHCGATKDASLSYQMANDKPPAGIETTNSWSALSTFTKTFSRPVTPVACISHNIILESYFNIESCQCFDGNQYLAILFHVLYPIYLASPQYRRFLKHGIEHGRPPTDEDCGSVISHSKEKVTVNGIVYVPCPQSQRLQDILLGCAAYFDESMLEKRLMKPDWLDQVNTALDSHFLAISVMDIRKENEKLVYSNTAFQTMTEYTSDDLLNQTLSVLSGPDTEDSQLLLLLDAMKPLQTAKLGITFYTKSKRAFTDLVAVKTTTHYSVAVHFPVVRGAATSLDELKEVDDLMILVAQLFQSALQTSDATVLARHHRHPLT